MIEENTRVEEFLALCMLLGYEISRKNYYEDSGNAYVILGKANYHSKPVIGRIRRNGLIVSSGRTLHEELPFEVIAKYGIQTQAQAYINVDM